LPLSGGYIYSVKINLTIFYGNELLYKKVPFAAQSNIFLSVIFCQDFEFFTVLFFYFFNSHSFFLFVRCLLHMLPAAPTSALAALERPSVAKIGPSVAAAGGLPRAGPPPLWEGFWWF
jgi:hypothetical protein